MALVFESRGPRSEGLNGGYTCRLSVKISLLYRFSVKIIYLICRLTVNLS